MNWNQQVFNLLKSQGISQISFVPDAGHASLIKFCERDEKLNIVRLTTEEEGISLAMGAWLGGQKSVLLMQSSGVGNIVNMLASFAVCELPLPIFVTMRGDWSEFNPWQVAMGQATPKVFECLNIPIFKADRELEVVEMAEGAVRMAFNTYRTTALLISQRVLGAKTFHQSSDTNTEGQSHEH